MILHRSIRFASAAEDVSFVNDEQPPVQHIWAFMSETCCLWVLSLEAPHLYRGRRKKLVEHKK
jgi:hypothetical protein